MTLDLKELKTTLTETALVSATKLDALLAGLPEDSRPADGEALLRLLIAQEVITFYQGQVLLRGKGRSLRLGSYLIQDKLGQGGMGMVFRAKHVKMKREVALKVVSGKVAKNSEMMQRFRREVEATGKLHHPNIVVAHDASEDNGTAYLVMEYIDGKDLSAIVKKKGPLTIGQAINMIRQAALGLEYAHSQGVIHRDIKPSNLLLDREGTLKILDMGLARFEEEGAAELTATGAVMGTIDYMAPEQAINTKDANAQSDIYSLGCTLWYLLLAKPMYGGESMIAKILAHRSQPTPSLLDEREDFPTDLQAIFEKMVAKKPENRYASMSELLADLDKFKSGDSDLTAMSSTYSSDDDQLEDFLDVTAGTAANPQVASKTKSRSVPSMSDVDTDQEFQTFMMPPVVGASTRTKRKKKSADWWQDWRVLSIMGGGLALILMIVLFAGGGGEKNSTVSSEPEKIGENSAVAESVTSLDPAEGTPLDPEPLVPTTNAVPSDPEKIAKTIPESEDEDDRKAKQEVYGFLIDKTELTDWKPLKIVSASSEKGAVLSEQPDGSLLASGENLPGDVYDITVSSNEPVIHAIRLESLPHTSLPRNGPGLHGSGGFQVDGFYVFRGGAPADSLQDRIPFSHAFADFEPTFDRARVEGILDEKRDYVWYVPGRSGVQNVLILIPEEPIQLTPGESLTIRISNLMTSTSVNLGCFRLTTSSAPLDVTNEKLLMALRANAFDESLSVSAAYLIKGHPTQALQSLEGDPSRAPTDPQLGNQFLLQVLLALALDDGERASESYSQFFGWVRDHVIQESSLRSLTMDVMVKLADLDRASARRTINYSQLQTQLDRNREQIDQNPDSPIGTYNGLANRLSQLGRWQEAADVDQEALKRYPDDELAWMRMAAHLLMAGNEQGYKDLCRDYLQKWGKDSNPQLAERICKTCLLLPGTVSLSKLPANAVQQGLTTNFRGFAEWYQVTIALGAYREKKYRDSLKSAGIPAESDNPMVRALGLVIRAMAEYQSQQTGRAEATYREVEQLIPLNLRAAAVNGTELNYIESDYVSHDWIFSEILRREAEALIFPPDRFLKKTLTKHSGLVFSVVYSPDGKMLASGAEGEVFVWDAQSGELRYALPVDKNYHYHAVAFSTDGKFLLTAPESRKQASPINVWEATDGKPAGVLEGFPRGLFELSFSPDGRTLVSGGMESFIRLWDFDQRRMLQDISSPSGQWSRSAVISSRGLIAFGQDKVYLAESNGDKIRTIEKSAGPLGFSPDGRRLAGTTWREGIVTVWNVDTGKEIASWKAHEGTANGVTFSRNGNVLVTAGGDRRVKFWDVETQRLLLELPHDAEAYGVAFSPDGNTLATCGYDHLIKLWDVSQLLEINRRELEKDSGDP